MLAAVGLHGAATIFTSTVGGEMPACRHRPRAVHRLRWMLADEPTGTSIRTLRMAC